MGYRGKSKSETGEEEKRGKRGVWGYWGRVGERHTERERGKGTGKGIRREVEGSRLEMGLEGVSGWVYSYRDWVWDWHGADRELSKTMTMS